MNLVEVGELAKQHVHLSARLDQLQTALHQLSEANSFAEHVRCHIEVRQGAQPVSVKVECGKDVARAFFEAEAARVEREVQAIADRFAKVE